ncbi:MAG: FHA domain-containing protein [Planctomycetes bacterium]|nr:FHA domain-containing protein [Planctomycetota bacterium]
MFELVFLTGARAGQVVPVVKTLLAGRSPECSLEVPDPNTSRQHSRFIFDGSSVVVADNGSSNGTYLNEVRLTAPQRLNHDDIVRMGESRIRFQVRSRSGSTSDSNPSSIFGFKEAEEDLSQSIVLSVKDLPKNVQSPEVLASRLNAIMNVSKALVNIRQLQQVFDKILDALFEVFPQADRGFLMLGDDIGKLEPKAIRQRGRGVTENISVSTTICRQALEKKGAVLFDDSKSSDFDQGQSIVSLRIRSAMTVPLMVEENVLGLLQIDTPDRNHAFTVEDLALAIAVSQQAAIALHNAQLLDTVEREATLRNNLRRFLAGPVADQVIKGQLDFALGGRTCTATVLFSDIIGFTRMSESLEPERVVALMNGYFSRMVPCIEQNSGSVDKFMGDAIMAVWGVPIDKGDSALNGVLAALAMQNALVGFNSLQAADGNPQVAMGIGLNSGRLVAGNIGTESRSEYTVLGDTVNTAQRLESNAGGGQILVSTGTWTALAGIGFGIAMPPLKVKNRTEPVSPFSLRGLRTPADEIVLHLPVRIGANRAWLTRRLADRSFLLLHAAELDVCAASLVTAAIEWPGVDLGKAAMESVLPNQASDGMLLRSQIRLTDDTLAGLLADKPVTCAVEWESMARTAVS